jgi:V/A-type H+/Na+-transporting ATPase subunit E
VSPTKSTLGSPEATQLAALIREQSSAEVAQLDAETAERTRRKQAAAHAEAERVLSDARVEGEARGRRRAARLLAMADAEGRKEWLQARDALIREAIDRARAQIANFADSPDAPRVLRDMVAEALAVLPDGPLRVRAPAEYAPLLEEALHPTASDGRSQLVLESDPVPGGGVIVETADGRLRFDNSFEARLRRQEDQLRHDLGELLFSDD